jgi:hypothetical protein
MDPNEHSHDRLAFIKKLEPETDRQLLERQTYYLASIEKSNESIKRNVQFFFWIFAFACVLSLVISTQLD